MLLYLYGKGEALIQHFLIKSFKSLQIVISHYPFLNNYLYTFYTDNLHYEKFADDNVKCIEDEIPFDVPEGWAWSRLHSLTIKIGAGSTPTGGAAVYTTSGIKFIRSQNVYDDGLILNGIAYISEEINQKKSGSIVKPKDILLNITGGSIGRCALVPDDFDIANVNQHVIIIRLANLELRKYIHSVITSTYIQEQILSRQVGSGRGGLSAETLSTFLIPLPPLNEQAAIERKLNDCISRVLTITDSQSNISDLISMAKSKILDLAIRGQLIPQNSDDEPASALLDRIRAEKEELIKQGKIKRNKKESVIFKGEDNSYYEKNGSEVRCIDEEIPFELPDRWNWARLKTICSKIIDGSHNPPKGSGVKTPYIMVSSRNIIFDAVTDLENVRYLNEIDFERENSRSQLTINDVLLTTVATLGRSCIYNGFPENLCFQRSVTVITTDILPQYLKIFFDAPYFQNLIVNNATGTAQKGFYLNQLEGVLVCVPPTDEQKRLSTKVGQILTSIQRIEKCLS